jgi:hypothetical protein
MFELVDAIKDLIATISGVPREIHVNTTYTESSTPPGDNGSTNHNAQGPDECAALGHPSRRFSSCRTRMPAGR